MCQPERHSKVFCTALLKKSHSYKNKKKAGQDRFLGNCPLFFFFPVVHKKESFVMWGVY